MTAGPIAAVVPAFHPDAGVVDLALELARQVDRVVVVVDGPEALAQELRPALEEAGALLVDHPENRGIAAALNTGIDVAGPEPVAILTVDQDSTVPPGYVQAVRGVWSRALAAGVRVGVVAPERVSGLPRQRSGRVPVQSGLLIPAATLASVGRFDETLFIDGVDTDFALRVLDSHSAIVVAAGVGLGHRLGSTHAIGSLGLTRSADFRYYYLTRNRLWLVRRHARKHPGWAALESFGLVRHLALVQTFVPGRRTRAAQLRRGLLDGLRS